MLKDDKYLVAKVDGSVIGAVWSRIMNDYGHIDNTTPSLAISLYKDYRRLGIGKRLLKNMLVLLKIDGYVRVSLSVQKENYAVRMYQNIGFNVTEENKEQYSIVRIL